MKTPKNIVLSSPFTLRQIEELRALAPGARWSIYPAYTAEEDAVRRADVILGNVPPEMLGLCESLDWLQLCTDGTDGYMEVTPADAVMTNGAGAYGPSISEHLLAMLLSLRRDLFTYHDNMRAGKWERRATAVPVEGSVVLVLGLGDLGRNFARRVKALGAYVIGVRRAGTQKPDCCDELYLTESLDALLPRADTVVLCLPNTAETRRIIDARRLALMKQSAVLLNVGRGSAIDQQALCEALNSSKIAAAGLDVAEPEPLPAGHPLWSAKNLLITPHASGGWHMPSVVARVKDIVLHNLRAYINEQPLMNIVDRSTGYKRTDT